MPDPTVFEFTAFDDGELGWIHVPSGEKVAGEFYLPAFLPDGYLICTVSTDRRDEYPNGFVAARFVQYGEEGRAATWLAKNGVELGRGREDMAALLR